MTRSKMVRLSEIAQVQSGAAFPDKYQGGRNLDFPLYKVSDMNLPRNEIEMTSETNSISEETRKLLGAAIFPKGSVIFPKVGGAIATNKKRLVVRDCCVDNNVMGVIPDTNKIDSRLLFYFFLAHDLSEFANDAGLPSIKKTTVENWLIGVVPPIAEQQHIVGILDAAFDGIAAARANAEQNLQNARALFESHLQAVFTQRGEGWEEATLEELLDRGWVEGHLDGNHGGDYPRKEEFIGEGIPYISANCLDNEQVDMSRAKFLSPARAALLRKGIANNKDVLFAHNATVGPVAILRTNEDKVILGTSLTYYRCNPRYILPEYLAQYMRSFEFKKQYLQVMKQSTRNQVPITKQREFLHIIPPVPEQEKLVRQLDGLLVNTQRLESLYQRKLAALDELKQSLLHQAFSGML